MVKTEVVKPEVAKQVKMENNKDVIVPSPPLPEAKPVDALKPSDNVVKVPKEKIEEDPWLDELLALEPLVQPYDVEHENAVKQFDEQGIDALEKRQLNLAW